MVAIAAKLAQAKAFLRSILSGYAQIYFGNRLSSGLLFLAATFVVPRHGFSGLLALLLTNLWALILGRPRKHIQEGYYAFNGLLVGLALGLFFRFSPAFGLVLILASLLTVLVAKRYWGPSTNAPPYAGKYAGGAVVSTAGVPAGFCRSRGGSCTTPIGSPSRTNHSDPPWFLGRNS